VLVGLACKNAILIIEFAKQMRGEGKSRFEATTEACRLRLRPILMTSFAFILGVVPMVVAEGAGAEMRWSLGTAVFSGMLGVTLFGILLTPVFFFVLEWFGEAPLLRAVAVGWLGSGLVGGTAGLALENDRLHAELRAQLAQLRNSRAEIVAVGDAERRRLERDLHDGAQQALAGLAMSLGLARAGAVDPLRGQRLELAQDAVRAGLAELRALAHRISPVALADAGLAAALGVLGEWAPQVEIARVPLQRLDPAVESAAYFAVAELARTTRGRIAIDARVEGATLKLDVLAADAPGSLIDLEDRVAVLDGELRVEPARDGATLLRITLPCAS
jgi:signal transduction histidine kinase